MQTNKQTMSYKNWLFNYAFRLGIGVWQSLIFYTENTIHTGHVNGYVKKRQVAFK